MTAIDPAAAAATTPASTSAAAGDRAGFARALAEAAGAPEVAASAGATDLPAAEEPGAAPPPSPEDGGAGPPTVTLGAMVQAVAERDAPFQPSAPAPSADGDGAADDGAADGVAAAGPAGDPPPGAEAVPAAALDHPGVAAAVEHLGVPYKWGGTDPDVGFDCSGFVQQAFADVDVSLPRVSADQARAGEPVSGGLGAAEPGDLVYWAGQGSSPNHIGIYVGDGQMLHAPRRGEDVQVDAVRQQPPDAVRRVA